MARRAQQGSVARCPYCEASLPQVAPECPTCRFPLTMAAADAGIRPADRSGTTSTATPGGRSAPPVLPGSAAAARDRVHGSRGHRMRVTAWLLAVTSFLLLLAGLGALFTASSSGAQSDRVAQTSLLTAHRISVDDPTPRAEEGVTIVAASDPSDAPDKISVSSADGLWFGAARSTSGSCYVLAVRSSDGDKGVGFLDGDDPCTGAQARLRAEKKLTRPRS